MNNVAFYTVILHVQAAWLTPNVPWELCVCLFCLDLFFSSLPCPPKGGWKCNLRRCKVDNDEFYDVPEAEGVKFRLGAQRKRQV